MAAAREGERVVVPVVADVTTESGRAKVIEAVRRCLPTPGRGTQHVSYVAHVVYTAAVLIGVGDAYHEMSPADLR